MTMATTMTLATVGIQTRVPSDHHPLETHLVIASKLRILVHVMSMKMRQGAVSHKIRP